MYSDELYKKDEINYVKWSSTFAWWWTSTAGKINIIPYNFKPYFVYDQLS